MTGHGLVAMGLMIDIMTLKLVLSTWEVLVCWLGIDRCKNSGVFIGRNGEYSIRSYANLPCGYMALANTITL